MCIAVDGIDLPQSVRLREGQLSDSIFEQRGAIMRTIGIVTLCAGLAVVGPMGCVDMSDAQQRKTLDEAEFREEVVGARLVWEGGETRYAADGTFTGLTGAKVLQGEWAFKDGKYCRSGSIDGKAFPYACETVILEGKTLTFVGQDKDYIYTIRK